MGITHVTFPSYVTVALKECKLESSVSALKMKKQHKKGRVAIRHVHNRLRVEKFSLVNREIQKH